MSNQFTEKLTIVLIVIIAVVGVGSYFLINKISTNLEKSLKVKYGQELFASSLLDSMENSPCAVK